MKTKEALLKELLALDPKEKTDIIEKMLQSLDMPDEKMDALWKKESERRIDEYEKGETASVSVKEAFSKYKKNA